MRGFIPFKRGRLGIVTGLLLMLGVMSAAVVWAAVTIENFEGEWQTDQDRVHLIFSTGSELDHTGFYVWRSDTNLPPADVDDTNAVRLTDELIVGNSCQAVGFDYTYDDTTIDPTKEQYYYYLESIPCSGGDSTFYGSQTAENSGLEVVNSNPTEPTYSVYMPLAQRGDATPTE